MKKNISSIHPVADDTKKQEDLELLKLTAAGDHASFEEFINRYQKKIRSYSQLYAERVGEEVDDLAQEIFLQIYQSINKFKHDSSVNTWVFSIAKFTINNKLRKKKPKYFWQLKKNEKIQYESSVESNSESMEKQLELSQRNDILHASLELLNSKNKEILYLFEFADLTYKEIGQILGIGMGAVKSRIFTARKQLTNILQDYQDE